MRGILTFNLNNEDDITRHLRAIHADEAFSLIWDIDQKLRSVLKYNEKVEEKDFEEIREMIYETKLMEMYN